jgi:hypothetical protein
VQTLVILTEKAYEYEYDVSTMCMSLVRSELYMVGPPSVHRQAKGSKEEIHF